MKFRKLFILKLAFKNIRLNWRHSLATALAIMFGFAAVSLFDGFMNWLSEYNFERYVNKGMLGHIIIDKKGAMDHLMEDPWVYSLSKTEQDTITGWLRKNSRVGSYMRYLQISGLVSNGKNNAVFYGAGIDEEPALDFRGPKWKWNAIAGKPLYLSPPNSILLGKGLALRMDCNMDDQLHLNEDGSYVAKEFPLGCSRDSVQLAVTTANSQANAVSLKIAGAMDFQLRELNDKLILVPLKMAQQMMDTDRISRIHVLLNNPSKAAEFIASMKDEAKKSNMDLEFVPWLNHPVAAPAKGGTEIMGVFRALFLSIVAIIASMSVANSMMKSISERIREIGTLRSFGFRRLDIRLLFSFEGLLLGLFSCLGGIGLSLLLVVVVQHLGLTINPGILSTPMPVTVSVPITTWLSTALLLSLITFLASWIVSRRAARMVIADALRYVA